MNVLPLHIAPDFNSVSPDIGRRSIIRLSSFVKIPPVRPWIESHKRASGTFLIIFPVRAISNYDMKVLEVFICISVGIRKPIYDILRYHNRMDHHLLA